MLIEASLAAMQMTVIQLQALVADVVSGIN